MYFIDRAEKQFTVEQRNAIKVVWIGACHFDCYSNDFALPFDKFQGLQRVVVHSTCRGVEHPNHESIRRSICVGAKKEVEVTLEHRKDEGL